MVPSVPRKPVTVPDIVARKRDGVPVVMVTAYDATFARLVDACDVDIVLVGDSLGMVMQGHEHTLEVTVEHMIYHARCVRRALRCAHLTVDMPFMSYQTTPEAAVENAGRLVKEGGAASVKLEGCARVLPAIERIVAAGIPVMGHLGLTPQSVHAFGGFKVQARNSDAAERLRSEAAQLEQAGCYSIVLEGIPAPLATEVSASLSIPTIGIGAGKGCDGQVLVMQDLLGLDDSFKPKFVKRYATLADPIREAFSAFAADVRARAFPGPEHSFGIKKSRVRAAPEPEPEPEQTQDEPPRRTGGYGPR
ncbi:3-methyl-2-oxobutanoate hydroxymethyltransferase [Enhygromyxa salina]|uniref:3-methyl-2-oxobutanoate hydroxymethyltransferase n=1 Tax=Enhygromyxa salina TaxID=215803 RepID=A0A2S9Y7M0_9BACT|nr:3-methyl-2-oxobutanoate hydroxymethyltransferase [Enhygromyxa salina]PRQ01062.1 3-methyl-2-oxobutanoate hydroxymethyltransferase [Enhygromyxa salina]